MNRLREDGHKVDRYERLRSGHWNVVVDVGEEAWDTINVESQSNVKRTKEVKCFTKSERPGYIFITTQKWSPIPEKVDWFLSHIVLMCCVPIASYYVVGACQLARRLKIINEMQEIVCYIGIALVCLLFCIRPIFF